MVNVCMYFDEVCVFDIDKDYCEECIRLGSCWVYLWMCLICGYVGCCDLLLNCYVSWYFCDIGYWFVCLIEFGECWIWCYVDEVVVGEVLL